MSHCHSVTIPSPSLTSSFQSLFRNFCCRFPCCIYRILGLLYHGQSFMVRALFVVNVSLCRSRGGVPVSLSRVALGVLRSSRDFLEASILDFLKWSEVCFGWLLDGWIALASTHCLVPVHRTSCLESRLDVRINAQPPCEGCDMR